MVKKKESAGGLRYVGQGVCPGVPKRDLSADEVEHFGREFLLSLRCPNTGGPLYAPADGEEAEQTQTIEDESEVE